jgi:large subunit ribosomal protein L24
MTINQETEERKKEIEKPLSFDDVRLVVAWFGANGTRKDVIIDKVRMERHSTGINPFTGEETGVDPETGEPIILETDPETGEEIHQEAAIPEEQQVDPNTGDPLYHRYVGYGSKFHRIPWPWEMDKLKQQKEQKKAAKDHVEEEEDKGLVKRTTGKVKSLLGRKEDNKSKPAAAAEVEQDDSEETRIALEKLAFQAPMRPPQEDFSDWDDDTTLNTVEIKLGNFDNPGHFIPTLVTPPHPLSVYDEIREMDLAGNGPSPEERQMQREMAYVAPPPRNEARLPKTPRQVFTELRLAKKKAERPEVIPFMGGLSREERKSLHQRFGLNLAEQFALRLQGERTTTGAGKVQAEPEMPKVDAELLRTMEETPELTDKNV